MKAILQKIGRALVVYAGAAYVGDQIVRPHWSVFRAKRAARKLDKPLLAIGYQLRQAVGDIDVDVAHEDAFPLDLDDTSIGSVVILHALEHADDPLSIAAECERVLVEDGEVFITCSSPYMLHAWFGRRWILHSLPDGRKQARPLWSLRKRPGVEGPETPVEDHEPPTETQTPDPAPETI